MENFDPVGGGFLVERILDTFFSLFGGGGEAGVEPLFQVVEILKTISAILLLIFVGGIIFVIFQLRSFRPKFRLIYNPAAMPQQKMARKRWEDIRRRLELGLESDWRLAIIEADTLVDEVFKKIGFEGESLGERLQTISSRELRSILDLREAHQTRNKVVHTPGYKISREETDRTLEKYQKVLEELEVI